MRAPEHSRAFNRTIRIYEVLANTLMESSENCLPTKKSRITPREVMKNPALARLLVAAAKSKNRKANQVVHQ